MSQELPLLYLSDKDVIEHPYEKLLAFMANEWRFYDGVLIAHDDSIGLFDIMIANMINARLDTASKIATIWDDKICKPAAERWLGMIPPRASLLSEDVPWDTLSQLFTSLCSIRYVAHAVATKILHKKRPWLIPIIDSVVVKFLLDNQPELLPPGTSIGDILVSNMKYLRERMLLCQPELLWLCKRPTFATFSSRLPPWIMRASQPGGVSHVSRPTRSTVAAAPARV